MSNTTKVPCGGFEIGEGLVNSGGVIEGRTDFVEVIGSFEYNQFDFVNLRIDYETLCAQVGTAGQMFSVVNEHEYEPVIYSNIQPIKVNGKWNIGFVGYHMDIAQNKLYYLVAIINEDMSLTTTVTSYTLTPST